MTTASQNQGLLARLPGPAFWIAAIGLGVIAGIIAYIFLGLLATALHAPVSVIFLAAFSGFGASVVGVVSLLKRRRNTTKGPAVSAAPLSSSGVPEQPQRREPMFGSPTSSSAANSGKPDTEPAGEEKSSGDEAKFVHFKQEQGGTDDWYYTDKGSRKGPVNRQVLEELLQKGAIDEYAQVWRKGMSAWQDIRETELGQSATDVPPPISGHLINNTIVWVVAVLPIVFAVLNEVIMQSSPNYSAYHDWGFYPPQVNTLPWFIPLATYSGLCLWDESIVRRAGHNTDWDRLFAALLVPVYLFVRAKRLKQRPTYAITWLAMAVLTVLLS